MKVIENKTYLLQFGELGKLTQVKVNDELSFSYAPLGQIKGYNLYIGYDKDFVVKVGCRTIPKPLETLKIALKNLKGEREFVEYNGLKNVKTNSVISPIIIEESENFFISKSGKAYLKKDYVIHPMVKSMDVIKQTRGNYWKYGNEFIYDNTKTMIETITYVISIIESVQKFQQELQNK
jgi:hypothetical protein